MQKTGTAAAAESKWQLEEASAWGRGRGGAQAVAISNGRIGVAEGGLLPEQERARGSEAVSWPPRSLNAKCVRSVCAGVANSQGWCQTLCPSLPQPSVSASVWRSGQRGLAMHGCNCTPASLAVCGAAAELSTQVVYAEHTQPMGLVGVPLAMLCTP